MNNSGGPAFPSQWRNGGDHLAMAPDGSVVAPGDTVNMPGMSLREYFAGCALAGLANSALDKHMLLVLREASEELGITREEVIARIASRMADAMLRSIKERR